MIYFNRPWADDLRLDDGTILSSGQELDAYLRQNGLASGADYSADFYRKVAMRKSAQRRKDLFAEFLHHYKRSIWNVQSKRTRFRHNCR